MQEKQGDYSNSQFEKTNHFWLVPTLARTAINLSSRNPVGCAKAKRCTPKVKKFGGQQKKDVAHPTASKLA